MFCLFYFLVLTLERMGHSDLGVGEHWKGHAGTFEERIVSDLKKEVGTSSPWFSMAPWAKQLRPLCL